MLKKTEKNTEKTTVKVIMAISTSAFAESNWPNNVKERVLTCTICLELYLDPKIMPCFHTFCKVCLSSHIANTLSTGRFPCPLCRTEIRLPKGGVEGFQSNFYIQDITELMREESATVKPTTGSTNHTKKPDSERDALQNCYVDQDMYCPAHAYLKEWVVSYCRRCRVPICLRCKLHEHAGHDWEALGVVVDEAQRELSGLDEKVKKYQKCLRGLSDDRGKHMAAFCDGYGSVSEQVRSNAEEIKQKVDFRCDALLMLLDHLKVTEASKVESHNAQVMNCTQALAEVKQDVDRRLKGSNVLNLLASRVHLQEKTEDAVSQIPEMIDKCTLVYDRKNTEGLAERIEAAMGYLSSQRDSAVDYDMEVSYDSSANASLALDHEPQLFEQHAERISEANHVDLQPLRDSAVRLVEKIDFKVSSKNSAVKFIVSIPHMGTLIGYENCKQIDVVNHVGIRTETFEAVGSVTCGLLVGQASLALSTSSPRQFIQTRMPHFLPISYCINLSISPTGIATRSPSELLICGKDKSGAATGIYRFCLETKQMIPVYTNGDRNTLKSPCSVVVTEDGESELFVMADNKRKSVFYFSPQGALLHTFPSQRCSFCPEGLCRDMEGNIVVADKGNNSVVVLSPRGVFMHELSRGVNPRVVYFDDFGRLWIGKSDGTVTINDYFV